MTERAGDEDRVTRIALDAGADAILGLGGDGTWSRIGAVLTATRATCPLALAAAGTGNDLAKNVGAPARDLHATAGLIWERASCPVDAIAVDDGWCLNVLGAGFDAAVLDAARGARLLSGGALYLTTALRQLFSYRGLPVRIEGVDTRLTTRLIVAVANGARFGGAFHVAPPARMDDGLLDLVAVADAGPAERVRLFGAVIAGRHLGRAGVDYRRTTGLTLHFAEPPVLDVDGEFRQAREARVRVDVRAAAIRIVTRSLPRPRQEPPAPSALPGAPASPGGAA